MWSHSTIHFFFDKFKSWQKKSISWYLFEYILRHCGRKQHKVALSAWCPNLNRQSRYFVYFLKTFLNFSLGKSGERQDALYLPVTRRRLHAVLPPRCHRVIKLERFLFFYGHVQQILECFIFGTFHSINGFRQNFYQRYLAFS